MTGYEHIEIGATDTWGADKRFIEKEITTTFMGMSVNSTEPGVESPFWHRHGAVEEIYVFLDGTGEIAVGDDVLPVGAGSVVRVDADTWRAIRALPDSAGPLKWLCIRSGGAPLADIGRDGELDRERPFPWAG